MMPADKSSSPIIDVSICAFHATAKGPAALDGPRPCMMPHMQRELLWWLVMLQEAPQSPGKEVLLFCNL
jgi:hypothetical protein